MKRRCEERPDELLGNTVEASARALVGLTREDMRTPAIICENVRVWRWAA
ncbi:MAG: hypothetical protein ABI868_19700 [Acidobacteriota bacterium]